MAMLHLPILDELPRPATRGDCVGGARPCPFVSCRHNNYLDVERGKVKLRWPNVEPEDVPPERSCSLDVADKGDATLEDIAQIAGLSRERVRQIEGKAFDAIREGRRGGHLHELAEDGPSEARKVRGIHALGAKTPAPAGATELVDDYADEDVDRPIRISFFMEGERANQLVTEKVWTLFAKDSTARGFDARSNIALAAAKTLARRRAAAKADPTILSPDLGNFYARHRPGRLPPAATSEPELAPPPPPTLAAALKDSR